MKKLIVLFFVLVVVLYGCTTKQSDPPPIDTVYTIITIDDDKDNIQLRTPDSSYKMEISVDDLDGDGSDLYISSCDFISDTIISVEMESSDTSKNYLYNIADGEVLFSAADYLYHICTPTTRLYLSTEKDSGVHPSLVSIVDDEVTVISLSDYEGISCSNFILTNDKSTLAVLNPETSTLDILNIEDGATVISSTTLNIDFSTLEEFSLADDAKFVKNNLTLYIRDTIFVPFTSIDNDYPSGAYAIYDFERNTNSTGTMTIEYDFNEIEPTLNIFSGEEIFSSVSLSDLSIADTNITFMTNYQFFSDEIISFFTTDNMQSSYNQNYLYNINTNEIVYMPVGLFNFYDFNGGRRLYLAPSREQIDENIANSSGVLPANSDVYIESRFIYVDGETLKEQILPESSGIHNDNTIAFTSDYKHMIVINNTDLVVSIYSIQDELVLIDTQPLDVDHDSYNEYDFEFDYQSLAEGSIYPVITISSDNREIILDFIAEVQIDY